MVRAEARQVDHAKPETGSTHADSLLATSVTYSVLRARCGPLDAVLQSPLVLPFVCIGDCFCSRGRILCYTGACAPLALEGMQLFPSPSTYLTYLLRKSNVHVLFGYARECSALL